jgi:hypothetical protein
MNTVTKQDIIASAASVARDAAEGRCDPTQLESHVTESCRALFADVIGPDDPLWPLQVEVCRGVLAHKGIPADELQEWLAVAKAGVADDGG